MATPPSSRVLALIPAGLGLLLVGMGAIFHLVARHFDERATAMDSWPTTPVTITSESVVPVRRPGETQDEDQLETTQEWTVAGHVYRNTTTEYLGWSNADPPHQVRHQAGEVLEGVYDPNNPHDMSLTRGSGRPPAVLGVLPWILGALSLPFFGLAVRFARARPRT